MLVDQHVIDAPSATKLESIRGIRNKVIHGAVDYKEVLTPEIVSWVTIFADRLEKLAADSERTGKLIGGS